MNGSLSSGNLPKRKNHRFPENENEEDSFLSAKRAKVLSTDKSSPKESESEWESADLDNVSRIPDEIISHVTTLLTRTAKCPQDVIFPRLVCKKFNNLLQPPELLSSINPLAMQFSVRQWEAGGRGFLKKISDVGNMDATYMLGMILFYCEKDIKNGLGLLMEAAKKNHSQSLYSLAIIQFNGSGRSAEQRKVESGLRLCYKAARHMNTEALRELGHCMKEGFGINQNEALGKNLLLFANLWELTHKPCDGHSLFGSTASGETEPSPEWTDLFNGILLKFKANPQGSASTGPVFDPLPKLPPTGNAAAISFMNDVEPFKSLFKSPAGSSSLKESKASGLDFLQSLLGPSDKTDRRILLKKVPLPANKFLINWFEQKGLPPDLQVCANKLCGRPEFRSREFRRCSICKSSCYCSRACQVNDWKEVHMTQCKPHVQEQGPTV